MQRYKLNVLCDEVYTNGSSGAELRKLRIRLAHKLIAFICDFLQGTHTITTAVQANSHTQFIAGRIFPKSKFFSSKE